MNNFFPEDFVRTQKDMGEAPPSPEGTYSVRGFEGTPPIPLGKHLRGSEAIDASSPPTLGVG